jgi:hypothetical protein
VSIEIRRVDPGDEGAIREFYDIYVAVGRHNGLGFIPSPYAELASLIRTPTEDFAYTGFLAYDGGVPVGEGWYGEFLRSRRWSRSTTASATRSSSTSAGCRSTCRKRPVTAG